MTMVAATSRQMDVIVVDGLCSGFVTLDRREDDMIDFSDDKVDNIGAAFRGKVGNGFVQL